MKKQATRARGRQRSAPVPSGRPKPAPSTPALNARAIETFQSLDTRYQVSILGLVSAFSKVPPSRLLATPDQRRQHAKDKRDDARRSRLHAAMDREEEGIKRQLAALSARLDLRRAAGKPVRFTSAEGRRRNNLYRRLNAIEERFNATLEDD